MVDLKRKSLTSTSSARAYVIEEILPVAWGVVVGVCQETEGDPALGRRAVSVVPHIQDERQTVACARGANSCLHFWLACLFLTWGGAFMGECGTLNQILLNIKKILLNYK